MGQNHPHIQPRWLSTSQAVSYARIGKARLKALAQSGEIAGAPDPEDGRGAWIFDRLSLDAYREAQLGSDVVAAKVAELRLVVK